jgi:hypothetical protein
MKNLSVLVVLLFSFGVLFISCESSINNLDTDDIQLNKKAGPNAVFSLNFSNASDAADNSAISAGWVVDRYSPEGFGTASFNGDSRLQINIKEAGPTSGFYAYQGKKYHNVNGTYWYTGANARFSYRFYIDPSWESDGIGQQTGVWPTLGDANGEISAYPILEYQDRDANQDGVAGFRVYVYIADEYGNFLEAKWIYLGIPKNLKIDPTKGGWVTVEAQLHKINNGAVMKWRINNILVADERGYNVFAPSTQFLEFIFNSRNFGADQNYYYDDVVLTDPGYARNN